MLGSVDGSIDRVSSVDFQDKDSNDFAHDANNDSQLTYSVGVLPRQFMAQGVPA